MRRAARAAWCVAAAWSIAAGCATDDRARPAPRLQFGEAAQQGQRVSLAATYDRAFDAARRTLRDMGFTLARVDAREGVLLTRPRWSGGIATPWIEGETTFSDEVDSALNTTRRVIRVRLDRPTTEGGAVTVLVDAVVERVYTPGRQVQTASIRLSGYYEDIDPATGKPRPQTVGVSREDPGLASEVANRIREALAAPVEHGENP